MEVLLTGKNSKPQFFLQNHLNRCAKLILQGSLFHVWVHLPQSNNTYYNKNVVPPPPLLLRIFKQTCVVMHTSTSRI